jgi:beta-1,4-mannosyltransferase
VNLVGYRGAEVISELQAPLANGTVTLNYIPDLPRWVSNLPRPVALPLKAILQLFALIWMLLVSLPKPDVILLQLPPALPTMVACYLAARRHRARLVYDWHNFAYTLMALTMGRGHQLVRLAERYERYWGKKADGGFCVTKAMQEELSKNWKIKATVFYDRPPEFFRPATLQEKHELLLRLESTIAEGMHPNDFAAQAMKERKDKKGETTTTSTTLCTTQTSTNSTNSSTNGISLRPDRPAIVVTSTSWTPDEDFGLLLAAAQVYDTAATAAAKKKSSSPASQHYPRLLIFVTGRGPQRAEFELRMRQLDLRYVAFRTAWLEPGDYPLLLGSADLGVSLHSSSSGLDLPMKVVDMFGAGLPVCALSYNCIHELVAQGRNGLLFSTAEELAVALQEALEGFSAEDGGDGDKSVLAKLRRGVAGSSMTRWHDSWTKTALPVIQGSTSSKR